MSEGQGTAKSVMFNGVKVGEFISTGSLELDARLAKKVLEEQGLLAPISLAARTFRQAYAFNSVAASLYPQMRAENPAIANIAAPFVVNISFAIELYLKAFAATSGVTLRGHKLDKLFSDLPLPLQRILESKMPATLVKYGQSPAISMSQALAGARDAFVDWRYNHERESENPAKIFYIKVCIAVADVLHHACEETRKV